MDNRAFYNVEHPKLETENENNSTGDFLCDLQIV